MNIAIIPARGGSKRIPRKNIKEFHGKPLIAYSIEAAKASKCFDRIIVSTDDNEIAEVAKKYGAEVPFIRPSKISDDFATTLDVMQHAIHWCNKSGMNINNVCCIYATAPFLLPKYIEQGLKSLTDNSVKYTFSATSFPFPIQRAIKLGCNNQVGMFQPEHLNTRSQDLEEAYHDAGQFYWGKASSFLEGASFFDKHSIAIKLPRKRVQDIDTPEDWDLAELLYAVINNKQ
ncbi:pseudaminic acid cytidylyltransferase [Colwellia hornerae]|uniref:Pseudaminic acid cytidylyltransferase n=1 Tax=Colwellia hornerae TaxID=89402 RepID=A0A5C6QKI4_9GAMM|nr:pseudaminic acid cytidylyltransferase [Colwellia hornerae]TWX54035.1 pseudaminic acid cytidylyltransferase [Colwellia hornerae]TWX60810.1 pseudaminic acid cytidylyltransferase [Colwellia hornerae]TWX69140.1 pseudaminic acid cytidylyltransferase [Colwellia hornerae]